MPRKAVILKFDKRRRRKVRPEGQVGSWTSDQWLQFNLSSTAIDDDEYIDVAVMSWPMDEYGNHRLSRPRKIADVTTTRKELERVLERIRPGRRLSTAKRGGS